MYAEKDRMKGVSENIILGQLVPMGTGSFDLMLDDTKLQDAIEVLQSLASPCWAAQFNTALLSLALLRAQQHLFLCWLLPPIVPFDTLRCPKSAKVVLAFQNDLGLLEENMIGGRTPGHGTPGRSPFGFGTPGRRDPEMYNSPFRSPLAGLSFGGFSPMQTSGFSPTRSPGGLGGTGYSPTSPGQLRILSVLMLLGLLLGLSSCTLLRAGTGLRSSVHHEKCLHCFCI